MKNQLRLAAFILVCILIFASVSSAGSFVSASEPAGTYVMEDLALTPGADPTQLNFVWYTSAQSISAQVQIIRKSDLSGGEMPDSAPVFTGISSPATAGNFTNKVTVTGLTTNTAYVYRIGDGLHWSDIRYYNTRNPNDYRILFFGDPQIGTCDIGNGNVDYDVGIWSNTLNKACQTVPDASFMLSVGDQTNNANKEIYYRGFFSPVQFSSLPIVAAPGNHEGAVPTHSYHFNNPNSNHDLGNNRVPGSLPGAGPDYYFSYGNTLYIVLNGNSTNTAEHRALMEMAVSSHPDAKWNIVMVHQDIYGSGVVHTNGDTALTLRETLCPIFDELGIDVVLTGHNHNYYRSYFMKNDEIQYDQTPLNSSQNIKSSDAGTYFNPVGILYISANASAEKYYNPPSEIKPYVALHNQFYVPSFAQIEINDTHFRITTYRTDTLASTDSITIQKGEAAVTADKIPDQNLRTKIRYSFIPEDANENKTYTYTCIISKNGRLCMSSVSDRNYVDYVPLTHGNYRVYFSRTDISGNRFVAENHFTY